jgi:hypothetical protein
MYGRVMSTTNPSTSKHRRWIRWLAALTVLALLMAGGLVGFMALSMRYTHQHCMKGATLGLRIYANDHGGKFPYHTNGFGDALLLFATGTNEYATIALITGPGDDGETYKAAMKNHTDVPEAKCSRVYVQGLSETNHPVIAIIFDRRSVRGGDHFRSPFRDYVREVGLLDGSMQVISDRRWPEFSRNQIELLVQAGIPRAAAEEYYHLAPK